MRAPTWNSVLWQQQVVSCLPRTDEGDFFALDSDNGKPLWHFPINTPEPRSNPVTYEVDGKQYVITAATFYIAFASWFPTRNRPNIAVRRSPGVGLTCERPMGPLGSEPALPIDLPI